MSSIFLPQRTWPGPTRGCGRSFVEKAKAYVHFDIYAWNSSAKPGGPEGGEAQAIRALYQILKTRYG